MKEIKNKAPDTRKDKQGIDMPYKIGSSYIGDRLNKSIDAPDELNGCIGFFDKSILCLKFCNIADICGRSKGLRI